jgi:hypothetical protein
MKAFAIWLVVMVVMFGGFAFAYDSVRSGDPDQVLVVVDTSFPMQADWDKVGPTLDRLDNEGYSEFALAIDAELVHGWSDQLKLGDVRVFAPRHLDDLLVPGALPEIDEATRLVIVTNADPAELEGLDEWEIVTPGD